MPVATFRQLKLYRTMKWLILKEPTRPAGPVSYVSLQDHHWQTSPRSDSADQRTEAKIACNVVNRMTCLGMPVTIRVA